MVRFFSDFGTMVEVLLKIIIKRNKINMCFIHFLLFLTWKIYHGANPFFQDFHV